MHTSNTECAGVTEGTRVCIPQQRCISPPELCSQCQEGWPSQHQCTPPAHGQLLQSLQVEACGQQSPRRGPNTQGIEERYSLIDVSVGVMLLKAVHFLYASTCHNYTQEALVRGLE